MIDEDTATEADDPPLRLEDILQNPSHLAGKSPSDIADVIKEAKQAGWIEGKLGRGSRAGQGFILREARGGNLTGRMMQWHPGGGHHGHAPYWKVSSGPTGTMRVGPQFAEPNEGKDR